MKELFTIGLFFLAIVSCKAGLSPEEINKSGGSTPVKNSETPNQKPTILPDISQNFYEHMISLLRVNGLQYVSEQCDSQSCQINFRISRSQENESLETDQTLTFWMPLRLAHFFKDTKPKNKGQLIELYYHDNGSSYEAVAFKIGEGFLQFIKKSDTTDTLKTGQFYQKLNLRDVKEIKNDGGRTEYEYYFTTKGQEPSFVLKMHAKLHEFLKYEDHELFRFSPFYSTSIVIYDDKVVGFFYDGNQKLLFNRQDSIR